MPHFSNAALRQIEEVQKRLRKEAGIDLKIEVEVKVNYKVMPPKAKKAKRPRIKTSAVCSCDPACTTYESSHKAHKSMLERNHKKYHNLFEDVKSQHPIYRTKIFGTIKYIKEFELPMYKGFNIEKI